MSEGPLTPTEAHEQLDRKGLLEASRNPGCYALQVTTPPDTPRGVFDRWTAHHDHAPQWLLDGLADSVRLAYVGAAGTSVYDRIQDHCEAEVRRAALLRVFPPTGILGVEASEDPFDAAEYNYCRRWVEEGWTVYSDGRLHGL